MSNKQRELQNKARNSTDLNLTPAMSRVVSYAFDNPHKNRKELAKDLGISYTRVNVILKHPRVIAAYPILARYAIRGMVPQAVGKYRKLMEQTDNLEVSRKVTERVLESSKTLDVDPKVQVNVFNTMSNNDLKEYLQRNNEHVNTSEGPVIDAEVIEEAE